MSILKEGNWYFSEKNVCTGKGYSFAQTYYVMWTVFNFICVSRHLPNRFFIQVQHCSSSHR